MANIDCCPHCGHPYHQSRSTTDPLSLINDHSFVSDLARFAEGIVSQQDVKKKYRLEESEWDALGENDELVRAVDAEKVRRIRNGSSARTGTAKICRGAGCAWQHLSRQQRVAEA